MMQYTNNKPTTEKYMYTSKTMKQEVINFLYENAGEYYKLRDIKVSWDEERKMFVVNFTAVVNVCYRHESVGEVVKAAFDTERMKKAGSGLLSWDVFDADGATEYGTDFYCDFTIKYWHK
jgi:hypothetical protein